MHILKITLFTFVSLSLLAGESISHNPFKSPPPKTPPTEVEKADPSFLWGGDVALCLDSFRSLPDGSWSGNNGAFASFNLAMAIPKKNYGFGAQVGGSYGLYDWNERGSNTTESLTALQQQGFITVALFRKTPDPYGLNGGIGYDLMLNRAFGVFALNPILGQIRGQLGYLLAGANEIGLWASIDTQSSYQEIALIPLQFRAISQVNLFWTHYFKNQAQTMVWVGTPYRRGLMYSSGRAGTYIFGVNFKAPLAANWSIVGHGSYMGARSGTPFQESSNYAANLSFGLNYSFGAGKPNQRPYLFLADNSNFLVDTNLNE